MTYKSFEKFDPSYRNIGKRRVYISYSEYESMLRLPLRVEKVLVSSRLSNWLNLHEDIRGYESLERHNRKHLYSDVLLLEDIFISVQERDDTSTYIAILAQLFSHRSDVSARISSLCYCWSINIYLYMYIYTDHILYIFYSLYILRRR